MKVHILEADLNKIQDALMAAQRALNTRYDKDVLAQLIVAQSIVATAKDSKADPTLRDAAFERYGSDDVEIDDVASASYGDEGAFVQAWVWVPDAD